MANRRSVATLMRALAPIDPPPQPETPPTWCRAFGTHAWRIVPPMLVLPAHTIRVRLSCERCGSVRVDRWAQKTGAIDGRAYDYTEAYTALLEETRADTRVALIAAGKPQPISAATRAKGARTDGAKGTRLQLMSSQRKKRVRDRPRRDHGQRGGEGPAPAA